MDRGGRGCERRRRSPGPAGLVLALLAWLPLLGAATEPLRVALSPDYRPLVFREDGELRGMEIDAARAVARILERPLTFVEMPVSAYVGALDARRVDVVMSGYSITPARRRQVAFTAPVLEIGQMAIVLAERAGELGQQGALRRSGLRIGVEPGTTGEEFARDAFRAGTILTYPDPRAAFDALRARTLDAFVHDAPTSWNLATSPGDADLLGLYRPLTREQLAWAVRREDDGLRRQLDAALAELRADGRLEAIRKRWIPVTLQVR